MWMNYISSFVNWKSWDQEFLLAHGNAKRVDGPLQACNLSRHFPTYTNVMMQARMI
jgi:hypothetical protein